MPADVFENKRAEIMATLKAHLPDSFQGHSLRAAHLGALASIGAAALPVFRQPRVTIVSSGDELVLLDREGREVVEEGARAGLVASVGGAGDPPTWFITGTDREGVRKAARLLEPDGLGRSYAVAAVDGESVRLPVERPGQTG